MMLFVFSTVNAATNELSKVSFTYENEVRAESQSLFYNHNDIQLKYYVDRYFDVFTDYRLIFQDKGHGFKSQNMFLEGFTLKYPEQPWGKVSLRNRIEIGLNPEPTPTSLMWNEFPKYNTPWKWTKYEINPFVAYEMFFDIRRDMNFTKNRIYVGVEWKITPKIYGSTYYYYETLIGKSSHSDVLVTQIRFRF
jgi:hypothetical protein